jgi:C4-dicarboxylate-specific signal transduction histidine kinase/ligand-binding sensor domain-containing protein
MMGHWLAGHAQAPAKAVPVPLRPNLMFRKINDDQGLTQLTVRTILQDDKGFMWFGTSDGLNKFNGRRVIKVYRAGPEPGGLSHGRIRTLFQDHAGYLWIGTQEGLDRLDPRTEQVEHFTAQIRPKGQPPGTSLPIVSLAEDRAHNLWVGTFGQGMIKIDSARRQAHHFRYQPRQPGTLPNDTVFALLPLANGQLWVGMGGGGIARYSPTDQIFTPFPIQPNGLSNPLVTSLALRPDGQLWVATYTGGLNLFNPATGRATVFRHDPTDPTSLASNRVEFVHQARDGRTWVCTNAGLHLLYTTPQGQVRFHRFAYSPADRNSLGNDETFTLAEDRTGGIWVGTINGGVNHCHPRTLQFARYYAGADGLSYDVIRCVYEDRDRNLWVGTTKGGLNLANPAQREAGRFQHYRHWPMDARSLSSDEVYEVYQDRQGHVWVGTQSHGLNRFVPPAQPGQPGSFERIDLAQGRLNLAAANSVRAIHQDSLGNLWIGTLSGLVKLSWQAPGRYTLDFENELNRRVLAPAQIADGPGGLLVIALTNSGLVLFDPAKGTIKRHFEKSPPNGLPENTLRGLYLQSDSVVWVGTAGGGLSRLHLATGRATTYTTHHGLPSNVIYSLQADAQGFLWLATNYGLAKFDPASGKTLLTYGETDGLQSREFNTNAYCRTRDGQLFFGGVRGLNSFYPSQLTPPLAQALPAPVISNFTYNNRPFQLNPGSRVLKQNIAYASGLFLPHDSTIINFEFFLPDYNQVHNQQFAYRLRGLTDQWTQTEVGAPIAAFSNLAPGRYELEVRGLSAQGTPSGQVTQLAIEVETPFWRSLWFFGLLVVSFVSSLLFGIRFWVRSRQRRFEAQKLALAQQVHERTEELQISNQQLASEKMLVEQVTSELRLLTQVGRKITSSLALQDILPEAHASIKQFMSADSMAIGVYNPELRVLDFYGQNTDNQPLPALSLDRKDLLSVRCFLNKEEIVILDYENEYKQYFEQLPPPQVGNQFSQSIVYLPLLVAHSPQPLGVMTVQSFQKDAYTPNNLEILRNLAAYTSVALENSLAYRELGNKNQALLTTQNQLIAAEKMASLGRLSAGIAHEINNPVNYIKSGSSSLEKNLDVLLAIIAKYDELDVVRYNGHLRDNVVRVIEEVQSLKNQYLYQALVSETRVLIQDINQGSGRIGETVRSMLDSSHHNQTGLTRDNVNRRLDVVLRILKYKIDQGAVEVVRQLDPTLPPVVSNHFKLHGVFTNIIDNALYALNGQGILTITTKELENEIFISIKDNGPGMTDEVKAKVFEPFFTTKEVGKGTGLGLALSFNIIQELGGQINVSSEVGKGAEFVITLPKQV